MHVLLSTIALWLMGTTAALAQAPSPLVPDPTPRSPSSTLAPPTQGPLTRGETLRYAVWWGLVQVGEATLTYTPQGLPGTATFGYVLDAQVWDTTPLITLRNAWRAQGLHSAKVPFSSRSYSALQQENDYRADKLVTFNPKTRQITYRNRRDATDTVPPLKWQPGKASSLRDAFSTVYAWRAGSPAALQTSATQQVMGIKRPFKLVRSAAISDTITVRNQAVTAQLVTLALTNADHTPSRDLWRFWLSPDAALTPLKIQAKNSFGTFTAILTK
jgi:hypothetical protein